MEELPADAQYADRVFIKQIQNDKGKGVGIGVKFDKFSQNDWKQMFKSDASEKYFFLAGAAKNEWDGKKLIINTNVFGINEMAKIQERKSEKLNNENESEGENKKIDFMEIAHLKIKNTLKFENKIKEIKGKHDWVKQINKHTIEIYYTTEDLKNPNLKNKDEQIIVITK